MLKILTAFMIAFGLATVAVTVAAKVQHTPVDPATLPACPTEDSVGCYWDAATRGNGVGRSYWTETDGTVHYLP